MSGQMPWRQGGGSGQLAPPPSEVVDQPRTRDPDSHVSLVASAHSSPEALLIGVSLGALSALLVVMASGYGPGDVLRGLGPAALFIGVWISSAWILTRDTGRVSVVLRRGFLLGTLQWGVLAIQWAGIPVQATAPGGVRPAAEAWPNGLMRDTSTVLVWVCLVGFVICWLCTRSPYAELETDRP